VRHVSPRHVLCTGDEVTAVITGVPPAPSFSADAWALDVLGSYFVQSETHPAHLPTCDHLLPVWVISCQGSHFSTRRGERAARGRGSTVDCCCVLFPCSKGKAPWFTHCGILSGPLCPCLANFPTTHHTPVMFACLPS
jgi:hypothetical protein